MTKTVLILSTSPRPDGNSEILAEEAARGARDAGNRVEKITLRDKTLGFCRGCLVCQTTMHCVLSDDADEIVQKMLQADAVIFATPVYFYGMSGQMKTLLDRTNPLFPADYAFREIYLIATAADTDESAADRTVSGLQGWIDCFPLARLRGVIAGTGADTAGSIRQFPEKLRSAYDLGYNL